MPRRITHPERVRWNLKRALLERRMIAMDLAQKVGTSRNYMSHIIMGRYPGWPYRKKVAKVLGYPEDWLFKLGDDDTPRREMLNKPIFIIRWIKILFGGIRKIVTQE